MENIFSNGSSSTEHAPILSESKNPVSFTTTSKSQIFRHEESNLTDPKDVCNQPRDRLRIVFFIFMLHGLGALMPWNMFITAKEYFVDFKLQAQSPINSTNYATNFLQYVGFASQIPNLVFNWLNIFVKFRGDLTQRVVYSLFAEIIVFIATVILAILDTSNSPAFFFWITMISIVLLNMANGIYQNTVYGMAARLPVKYTGSVVLGSNICGVFATIISITSSSISTSKRTAAIYYFITAKIILLLCFDTYFVLPLNKFFRYHETRDNKSKLPVNKLDEDRPPYWKVFKQAFLQLFNIFFTFFITLAIFPAVHSDIKQYNQGFLLAESQFTAITCFLTFNLFAMIGSLTSSFFQQPKPKYLVVPVVLRVFLLPLFLLCNYKPKGVNRLMPVLIYNEWLYWMIAVVMSFSSGYLSSLGMMYAPKTVSQKYQVTAGMFAAAALTTGIFSGVLFSMLMPRIVADFSF